MKNNIPVVIFHDNDDKYLEYSIKSAEKFNETVVLLGTKKNKDFCKIWFDTAEFDMSMYKEFEKVYMHMSSNTHKFEITAFKKYYVLQQYMETNEIEKCVLLDSDVLTYVNYSDLPYINSVDVSVALALEQPQYRWTASGHTFICSKKALNDFISFFYNTYKDNIEILNKKWEYHIKNNVKGGICDMTLLYLWINDKNNSYSILNILEVNSGSVFDNSMQSSSDLIKNQYKYNKILKLKKVNFKNGLPYFEDINNKLIKVNTLHFQGSSKAVMGNYLKKDGVIKIMFNRYRELIKRVIKK